MSFAVLLDHAHMLWAERVGANALDTYLAELGVPPDETSEAQANLSAMLGGADVGVG